jgi:hypothetical protein
MCRRRKTNAHALKTVYKTGLPRPVFLVPIFVCGMASGPDVERAGYGSSGIVLSSPPFQQQSKVNLLESRAHWALIRDIETDVGGAERVFVRIAVIVLITCCDHVKCRIKPASLAATLR